MTDLGTLIVSRAAEIFMIFGGIVPYIPQYRLISKVKHCDGFSTYVCLTLLLANILRLCFWFGRPFEIPLVLQSIIMIITMIIMIKICVKVSSPELGKLEYTHSIWDFDFKYFWKWTDFSSYVFFILIFSALSALFTQLMIEQPIVINMIGFLALLLESMLGAPQFYRNFKNRSTKGMSVSMVAMWTSGDMFKTIYFIIRHSPEQFIVCGALQVTLDILILLQYAFYDKT